MISNKQRFCFILLITSQCAHSIEEVHYKLWEVFAPARFVGSLFNSDISLGFTIANILLICIGLLCTIYLLVAKGAWSRFIIFSWASIELINFAVHTFMSVSLGAYFPGVYTAPLLLLFSVPLIPGVLNSEQQSKGT